ncbi:MAG: hypothetical protein F4Y79_15140 [Gemmatimonadetes bacterium]|nr:hypothetical protein [Gemmatimonadota bacterium]
MAIQTDISRETHPDVQDRGITVRAVMLGILTIALMTIYITHFAWNMIKNYMPVSALIPFVAWVGINAILKLVAPKRALSRTEMLTIFFMVWLVGNLPTTGWAGYLLGNISAPVHLASPENRVGDVIAPLLPDWLFMQKSPVVIGQLYGGLEPNTSIPWQPWIRPLFWWTAACLSVVMAGFFCSVLFFKQWHEKERLTFPMATFPTEMLREEPGYRLPVVFHAPLFWGGFGISTFVICWNIAGYFVHTLPHIPIYDLAGQMAINIGYHYPRYFLRMQPLIMGLAYLCPLDLLFSFWFYNVLNIIKEGLMNQTGITVGLQGQQATPAEILSFESHGALVFLVAWSLWVSRKHLKNTLECALMSNRAADDGTPVTYRTAWLGLAASVIFLAGWCLAAGMELWATIVQLILMFIALFGVAKYAAATGFTFLSPGSTGGLGADKGGNVWMQMGGTANMSPGTLTTIWMINRNGFAGMPIRLTATMSVPHYFRMLGNHLKRHPMVWAIIPIAYITGCITTATDSLYRSYMDGGMNGPLYLGDWNHLVRLVPYVEGSTILYFDIEKLGVWLWGFAIAGFLTYIRTRFSWWPFNPVAIAFPTRRYGFSLLVVWATKALIMRFGGVALYRKSLPFWYGLMIGYLLGVGISTGVDAIWFPDAGHIVHGW